MRLLSILSSFLFFGLPASGQTTIQLILKNAGNHKIEKADAFDLSQKELYEAAFRDTIVFTFNKKNIDCYNIRYLENGKMYRQQIWLDTGHIKIEAHISGQELVIDTVINSPFYYTATGFIKKYTELYQTHDTSAINDFLLSSFRDHLDNPFSLNVGYYFVMLNQNAKPDLLKFRAMADKQGDKFSWFLLYPMVIERVNKMLTVDRINLSHYSFIDKDNNSVSLPLAGSDYYVLDFWFLNCRPCIEQHVTIKERLSQLKDRKVELIGISTDRNVKKWKAYLDEHGYSWKNFLQDQTLTITKDLDISTFPTYIILNNAGEIIDTFNSFSEVLKRFQVE